MPLATSQIGIPAGYPHPVAGIRVEPDFTAEARLKFEPSFVETGIGMESGFGAGFRLEPEGGFSQHDLRRRRRSRARHALRLKAEAVMRRVVDFGFAALLLAVLSPLALILFMLAKIYGGGIETQERLGYLSRRFFMYRFYFPGNGPLTRLRSLRSIPTLVNILVGEMSFVGPRPLGRYEALADRRLTWKRYEMRPGLVSLWWVRKHANIAHGSELSLDLEYVDTTTFWGDIGIALRAIPIALFFQGASRLEPEIEICGIRIDNFTMEESVERVVSMAGGSQASQICFVNADCVNTAFVDADYRAALGQADMVLADGIGMRLAGAVFEQNVRENINGTDMLPFLLAEVEQAGLSIFLLGGAPGVAEAAAKWIHEHFPELRVAGTDHGFFTPEDEPAVIQGVKDSGADILFVCMGAPTQEKWIAAHKDQVGAKVLIAAGGLLDFYAGRVLRAPIWVRELGMEWFYRFLLEPWRMWRRYFLGNLLFLARVLRTRLTLTRGHSGNGRLR